MGTRCVLGRSLKDFLLAIAADGPLTARDDIGAVELVSHETFLSRSCRSAVTLPHVSFGLSGARGTPESVTEVLRRWRAGRRVEILAAFCVGPPSGQPGLGFGDQLVDLEHVNRDEAFTYCCQISAVRAVVEI